MSRTAGVRIDSDQFWSLRARAEINSHFGASAGRADARRRDEGDVGHRRGAATKQMPTRRRAPPGCGPQARWLCCSLLTYRPGYSSSLAPRQRAWGTAAKWEVISARALRLGAAPGQAGAWERPITFPPGSRNLAVISGASPPIGCTISPPLATITSIVAATLSTIT